jgi:hypothetical protein
MHGDRLDVSGAPPLAQRIGSGSRRHISENNMRTTGNLKSKKRKSATNSLSRSAIFGPAPILRGEDSKAYDRMLEQATTAIKPSDIFEDIWVADSVYLTWEILRLRRYKRHLIETTMTAGLIEVLGIMVQCGNEWVSTVMIAKKWVAQDREVLELVDALLDERGYTMDTVWARAFACQLDNIERIEKLIAAAEARRNRALNEIDFRREFAHRVRKNIDEIEGAEPKIINHKAITQRKAVSEHDQCTENRSEPG